MFDRQKKKTMWAIKATLHILTTIHRSECLAANFLNREAAKEAIFFYT